MFVHLNEDPNIFVHLNENPKEHTGTRLFLDPSGLERRHQNSNLVYLDPSHLIYTWIHPGVERQESQDV